MKNPWEALPAYMMFRQQHCCSSREQHHERGQGIHAKDHHVGPSLRPINSHSVTVPPKQPDSEGRVRDGSKASHMPVHSHSVAILSKQRDTKW